MAAAPAAAATAAAATAATRPNACVLVYDYTPQGSRTLLAPWGL